MFCRLKLPLYICFIINTKTNIMKITKNGFRINRNGKVIKQIEKDAIVKTFFAGNLIKQNGCYYYFNRNQSGLFIYLP